ncbi:glutaminase A [Patulibacter brassicae]|uniref:Glutaminase n=1 Tax=Patulibacter brassicae TaxID=1705717 RepID=A0ABU4VFC5_9ACTN|nr:glutaminase A [Patulibacter brassicae]MDX8150505.1 glutaminase A [Patulibacter brassicae]
MRSIVEAYLSDVHAALRDERGGAVADYIPELAAVPDDDFAIALCTTDGALYAVGDADVPFTIQSISKPFTYALALADHGVAAVDAKVGVEPSGDAFNEISLEPDTGRPRNPMINAGAITTASLVAGGDDEERFARVRALYSACAGRTLELDEAVFGSELESGHRNRAIGYMLRTVGILEDDPEPIVARYFRQCALRLDVRDLARMAATLAAAGISPTTGERVLPEAVVERTLGVMTTCGMYDAAGDWVTAVGLPAKSGVGGGILAVLPGQLGIAIFSPRLDAHGNSVRGVAACQRLAREMELHMLHVGRPSRSAIRAAFDVVDRPSRLRRNAAERDVLQRVASRGRVYELHGDLLFSGAESVVRAVTEVADELDALVLDVRRVDQVADVARRTLVGLRAALAEEGIAVALVDPERRLPAEDDLAPPGWDGDGIPDWDGRFTAREPALEWCEDRLLERHGTAACLVERLAVEDHPLVARLPEECRGDLVGALARRTLPDGEVLARRGDDAVGIGLLLRGRIRLAVTGADGVQRPLWALGPGAVLGEVSLLDGSTQLTDLVARGEVELALLTREAFDGLEGPTREALLRALVADAYVAVRRTSGALAERLG